jgi:hypothetical protein
MKSMMAELTDETNMARGFALISVGWAVGGTIGLVIFFPLIFCPISGPLLDPSLVGCYRGHKIVGQLSSRILSGANTHTSFHVSPPPHMRSYHFLWLRFS